MNLGEIRKEKKELEDKIQQLLDAFVEKTGLDVEELDGHCFIRNGRIYESNVIVKLESI